MQVFITYYGAVAELERYMYVVGRRRGGCGNFWSSTLPFRINRLSLQIPRFSSVISCLLKVNTYEV